MNGFEFFIRRPVFSTVLSLVILLCGIVSYGTLTVREYPNIDQPVVNVTTEYLGASAEIIESQVSQILEASIAGIAGIETISSNSRSEISQITVRFRLGTDPDVSASDVRDRVGRVRKQLPAEILEPIIAKVEADAQAIINIALTSDRHKAMEISDYADRYIRDQLQNLPGVSEVRIFGERRYAMRIWVDRARLVAHDLTVQDVETALRQQNVEVPSGRIEGLDREFTVLSRTGLKTPEEFRRIVVKDVDGFSVRLGDLAKVEVGPQDERRSSTFKGETAVVLGIVKQATANPLDVSLALRKVLPQVGRDLPAGMSINLSYDRSVFIEESIKEVYKTIAEAVVLVVIVIFIFLRTFRATIVPLVTIPVSLIGAFAIMAALGFSINSLTLLAMVLAIGLVVDDAIVVLENIHRHIEDGMQPLRAAIVGIRELSGAVIAMTLTLAAVYAPVAFSPGRTGKLFAEFALTLAGAVLVSGFVALTLTPMMCAKLLKSHEKHGRLYNMMENGLNALNRGYRRLLIVTLKLRPLVMLVAVGVAASSYFLFMGLKSELAPIEDRGVLFTTGLAPEGSTIEFTNRYSGQIQELLKQIPEVETYFVITGSRAVNELISFSRLKPWSERDRSQMQIAAELAPKLAQIAGVRASVNNPGSFGQSPRARPIEFVIQTAEDYKKLDEYVNRVMTAAQAYPGLVNVDSDLDLNKPQLLVDINRDRVADRGVNVLTVGQTLETLLGGRRVTRFIQNGEQYDVVVQVQADGRRTPGDLADIYVRGRNGTMIQLTSIVRTEETVAPKELNRFNQFRSATISANLAPGYALGEALNALEKIAGEVLPDTARYDYSGVSREFKESGSSLYFIFLLALCFIFLVLAAQFESFIDPLIIMFTVPLSMTGALLALNLTGTSLNIYSQIGLVTLIGLITKHGILIVQFANQLQDEGKSLRDSVVEAASLRLRPILMTTGAMVGGAVPLAMANGAGAMGLKSVGWVIVGGMTFGTVLTLFVVPTAYTLLARDRSKLRAHDVAPVTASHQPAE
ncbi:MAG: efflux RND transporter permease subunit [Pseudolabrys sp.]|nr:efflux RND transporter permease subunit [Pseudolabrys sp.]MDP2295209.1 efflux RND transporter permease subunit [Pseudolabrys sp.]